jgi:hypothetical protein
MYIYELADVYKYRHKHATTVAFEPSSASSRVGSFPLRAFHTAAQAPQPGDREPNRWILILETTDSTFIKMELRQCDPTGSTITVCAEGPQISADGEFEGCLKSFPIPLKEGLVVNDVLRILFSTGTTRYILVKGNGKSSRRRHSCYSLVLKAKL